MLRGLYELKRVVVLMSTYNGEKYLKEQIESILKQEGKFKLDLWVRDDGSTDRTKYILDEYAQRGDLIWYVGKNVGSAQSFMKLVANCTGYDYYAFADQDDVWNPDKLDRGIKKIENCKKAALYFSNARLVDAELNDIGRNVYKKIPRIDFYTLSCAGGILGCTIIINEKLVKLLRNEIIPKEIVMHDFYIALVCKSLGGDILYEDEVTMRYRQHGTNVIGVPYGLKRAIKSRIRDIVIKPTVSISNQAEEVLRIYGNKMFLEKRKWLQAVAEYKLCLLNKIQLALSRKVKYINFSMGLKIRIAILLGNR